MVFTFMYIKETIDLEFETHNKAMKKAKELCDEHNCKVKFKSSESPYWIIIEKPEDI